MGESDVIAAAPASPWRLSGMFSYLLIVIFTIFVFYPLSVGPAIVLHDRSDSASLEQAIELFYRPLLFACERVPIVGEFVFAYAGWWDPD